MHNLRKKPDRSRHPLWRAGTINRCGRAWAMHRPRMASAQKRG
jgi:hypothetical protein